MRRREGGFWRAVFGHRGGMDVELGIPWTWALPEAGHTVTRCELLADIILFKSISKIFQISLPINSVITSYLNSRPVWFLAKFQLAKL